MLEVAIALVAGLLLLIGILIMAGPQLSSRLRSIFRRRRALRVPARRKQTPSGTLHPTTSKALAVANRIATLLKEQGLERHVAGLRHACRRLEVDEPAGIYAMQEVLRHIRGVRLPDREDQDILEGLIGQLRKALKDRAEQLEILPRG